MKLIVTDLGVFEPRGDAYLVKEVAPGYSLEDIAAVTAAPLVTEGALAEITV